MANKSGTSFIEVTRTDGRTMRGKFPYSRATVKRAPGFDAESGKRGFIGVEVSLLVKTKDVRTLPKNLAQVAQAMLYESAVDEDAKK